METQATILYPTNLPNAPSLIVSLDSELARCGRLNLNLAMVVCDFCGFRAINERFGHRRGDRALWFIATGLRQSCRLLRTRRARERRIRAAAAGGCAPERLAARIEEMREIALAAAGG
jgi:GGDEF domain-containing protein